MQQAALRNVLRWFHILGGLVIGTYLYSPWSSDPVFTMVTLYIVTPAIVISGVCMWQQGKIARWLRRKT